MRKQLKRFILKVLREDEVFDKTYLRSKSAEERLNKLEMRVSQIEACTLVESEIIDN